MQVAREQFSLNFEPVAVRKLALVAPSLFFLEVQTARNQPAELCASRVDLSLTAQTPCLRKGHRSILKLTPKPQFASNVASKLFFLNPSRVTPNKGVGGLAATAGRHAKHRPLTQSMMAISACIHTQHTLGSRIMGGSDQLTGIIVINRTTDTIGTTGKVYPV